jgi:drug/metabolite transporter (DMT)-like permease
LGSFPQNTTTGKGSRSWALASALAGCSLWGISAVAAQFIFDSYSFPPLALVAIRMPIAGIILYVIFRPARPKTRLGAFIAFSVVGLWVVQYTYFLTIASSNAATGTLLQFLSLPMIAAYEILVSKARASAAGVVAVAMATIGTAELVAGRSNASIALLITPIALVAGLLTAASAAYYTIASKSLLRTYGSTTVTTWGLLFGSAVAIPAGSLPLSGYSVPVAAGGSFELLVLVAFVVLFGTLLAFLLYFKGLERISPTEAGIAAALEPITAAVVSFFVLHVVLTPFQYLGGLLIIGAVAMIVLRGRLPL